MSEHKKISIKDRQAVYNKYNGHCAYCGCEIAYSEMQVEHIKSVYKYTDNKQLMNDCDMYNLNNYMPACRQCNFYKSTFDLEDFRKRLTEKLLVNLKKDFNYRLCLKYGLIEENIKPIVFYFENH